MSRGLGDVYKRQFYNNMMSEIREAIEEHRYSEYKRQKLEGFQNQE